MRKAAPCGYCFGELNGMDRWFMQPCVCVKACGALACKGKKRMPQPARDIVAAMQRRGRGR